MITQRLSLLTFFSLFSGFVWRFKSIPAANLWVTAYYPGTAEKIMPASEIDFAVITHVIQFALVPNADGTLDERVNVVARTNVTDLVQRAHADRQKSVDLCWRRELRPGISRRNFAVASRGVCFQSGPVHERWKIRRHRCGLGTANNFRIPPILRFHSRSACSDGHITDAQTPDCRRFRLSHIRRPASV